MMAVLDVEVLCGGKPVLRYVQAGRAVPEYDEPFSNFIRKRTQQPIEDAEDCGIRADSDGQRVRGGMTLAFWGVGIGIAGAVVVSQLMRSLLFGVGVTDVVTFVAVPALLACIAFFASYIPARRASRIDPSNRCDANRRGVADGAMTRELWASNPHTLQSARHDCSPPRTSLIQNSEPGYR
jgi:hypothetical protein